jgi:hypothetical protein
MDMMHGALGELLFLQWSLQVDSFDLNPQALDGDARAEFVRWNVLALEDELRDVNAQRQADGYTGTDKCPQCKRDKATTIILKHNVLLDELHFCPCGYSYDRPEPKPVDEEADRVRRASL